MLINLAYSITSASKILEHVEAIKIDKIWNATTVDNWQKSSIQRFNALLLYQIHDYFKDI